MAVRCATMVDCLWPCSNLVGVSCSAGYSMRLAAASDDVYVCRWSGWRGQREEAEAAVSAVFG